MGCAFGERNPELSRDSVMIEKCLSLIRRGLLRTDRALEREERLSFDDVVTSVKELTSKVEALTVTMDSVASGKPSKREEYEKRGPEATDKRKPRNIVAKSLGAVIQLVKSQRDPSLRARERGYARAAALQWGRRLTEFGLPPWWSLLSLLFWLSFAGGLAYAGWIAAPTWFPNNEDSPLPVHRTDIAKAAAVGLAVLTMFLTSPLWFQRAKQLRPILVPGFLLLSIALVGGAVVLLAQPAEPSETERAYLLALGVGIASVLTASVKWAFDTVSLYSENLRRRNESMGARVEMMINDHYSAVFRRARELRTSLRELHRLNEFAERSALTAERDLATTRAAYRIALLLREEQLIYESKGAIFLASRRIENRVVRLLAITHLLLGLGSENEEELIAAVEGTSASTAETEATSRRVEVVTGIFPLPFSRFLDKTAESVSLQGLVRLLGHRLESGRLLVGLHLAVSELRSQLFEGINDVHKSWYKDWQPVPVPRKQLSRERRIHADWAQLLRKLVPLMKSLDKTPSDVVAGLSELIEDVGYSLHRNERGFLILYFYIF